MLLHGFTNNPRQYELLGRQLFADGANVLAPRFPYHGFRDRTTAAIAELRTGDVLRSTIDAVRVAARLGERVAVIGISLGGAAAVWAASRLAIHQAIAVSPFFRIRGAGAISPALHRTLENLPNAFLWWDPVHHERDIPAHVYPKFSTHALGEILYIDELVATPGADRAKRIALVLNPREPLVSNRRAIDQCRRLERAGIRLSIASLAGLPAQHDIIEPQLPTTHIERVYPVLRELVRRP